MKFEAGKTYTFSWFYGDGGSSTLEVISRTEKTVEILYSGEKKRKKIYSDERGEYIMPTGNYSYAPVCRAFNVVEQRGKEQEEKPMAKMTVEQAIEEIRGLTTEEEISEVLLHCSKSDIAAVYGGIFNVSSELVSFSMDTPAEKLATNTARLIVKFREERKKNDMIAKHVGLENLEAGAKQYRAGIFALEALEGLLHLASNSVLEEYARENGIVLSSEADRERIIFEVYVGIIKGAEKTQNEEMQEDEVLTTEQILEEVTEAKTVSDMTEALLKGSTDDMLCVYRELVGTGLPFFDNVSGLPSYTLAHEIALDIMRHREFFEKAREEIKTAGTPEKIKEILLQCTKKEMTAVYWENAGLPFYKDENAMDKETLAQVIADDVWDALTEWIGNELDKSFAPKVKEVERLKEVCKQVPDEFANECLHAYIDAECELARDVFSWILARPDFHDPDPDNTETTPPTLKAASEYLEMLIENLPYQDKRILLEIVDMWAVGLDYGDEVKAS